MSEPREGCEQRPNLKAAHAAARSRSLQHHRSIEDFDVSRFDSIHSSTLQSGESTFFCPILLPILAAAGERQTIRALYLGHSPPGHQLLTAPRALMTGWQAGEGSVRSGTLKFRAPGRGDSFDAGKRVEPADGRPSTTSELGPSVGSLLRPRSTETPGQLLRATSRGTFTDGRHSMAPAFQQPAQLGQLLQRTASTSPIRPRSRQAKAQGLPREPEPTKAAFKVQHLVLKMSPMPARVRPQIVDVASMLTLQYEGAVRQPAIKPPGPMMRGDSFDPFIRGALSDDRPSTAPAYIPTGVIAARPHPAEAPRRKEAPHAHCKSGVLHVTIVSCSELPRADHDSSDPYSATLQVAMHPSYS